MKQHVLISAAVLALAAALMLQLWPREAEQLP